MAESHGKRSLQDADYQHKRRRSTPSVRCEKDLAHIIALCDGRIPFIKLTEELRKKGIPHQGIQTDSNCTGLVLKLIRVPNCQSVSKETNDALAAALLSCSFRLMQRKSQGLWKVELIFCKCPVVSSVPKEQGPLQHVYLHYEMNPAHSVLDQFFQDWESIANLYELVLGLPCALPYLTLAPTSRSSWLQEHSLPYSIMVDIVTVKWDFKNKEFKLMFGVIGPKTATNCHSLLRHCMQQELNVHKALPVLLKVLCYTQSPLQAICKLPIMSIVKSSTNGMLSPAFSFVLLPQSSSHFRLMYGTAYYLEIHCKGKNAITIKDGAYSHFNIRTNIDGYISIPGLKAFLDLHVDDTASNRRHAIAEEDNPASPMDTLPPQTDPFMAGPPQQHPAAASPMFNQKMGTQGATGGLLTLAVTQPPLLLPILQFSLKLLISTDESCTLSNKIDFHHFKQYSMSPGASAYPLASPPNIIPSPSGVMRGGAPSPALATGSPHHVPSPSSSFIHTPPPNIQLSSPGQFISPPRIPRHSRTFPFRSAAATLPTLLSHDALHKLCTPSMIQGLSTNMCSPMERFLGAALMKKQIQKHLQNQDASLTNQLQVPATTEMGSIQFYSESLHYKISMHPATMQYLQLSVRAVEDKEQYWTQDELRILEKYFETKVACPPFKNHDLVPSAPDGIHDDLEGLYQDSAPGAPARPEYEMAARMIKLTCINPAPPPGQEPLFETVGIVYDKNANLTSAVNLVKPRPPNFTTIENHLKNWNEYNMNKQDCSLFPAIRSLMTNLQLKI
ncbi:putative mediator of RNA polymerase II transcription subunit 14 [Apostichopus japonicus]|uniref:Putative mediator of RNA polymerase II transcription subunit 14 n=1 Tax=Stichopus japonicus TaxID=307972 RepID=A0A2G8KIJ5_STIJA|nr:putative mediator of RNA polymerase II transcription subunit 14 [Apostichopus japonicus]